VKSGKSPISVTAKIAEMRAQRTARAFIDLHRAMDAAWIERGDPEEAQAARLGILRELAVMHLERLSPRLRRNGVLRAAIEATCRAYRDWSASDPGTDVEHRRADDLAVRAVQLHGVLGPPHTVPTFVLADPRPPPLHALAGGRGEAR
jgi:hypothetical protein